jgi:hypothetical protein
MWAQYVQHPVPSLDDLQRLLDSAYNMQEEDLGYTSLDKTDGFFAVMDCLNAMMHCTTWLKERLARVGWKTNMTGYEPTAVSHSTTEVLQATIECNKMIIKQMILFVTHSK